MRTPAVNRPTTEMVDVVTVDDVVLASKPRSELVDGVDRWRMVVVLVTDGNGRVLLGRRAATKRHDPGVWSSGVVGTVSSGHSYLDTAVRETAEEIGLTVDPSELVERYRGCWDMPGQLRNTVVYELVADVPVTELNWDRTEADLLDWFDLVAVRQQIADSPHLFVPRAAEMLAHLG